MPLTYNSLAPTLELDGPWQFRLGTTAPWGVIEVPGCWEAQGYPKTIDGPAYYRREVTIPGVWQGEAILLDFDGVSYAATIFCNGQRVGEHIGLWTPFSVDLTTVARPGEINTIELELWKPANHPVDSTLGAVDQGPPPSTAPPRYPLRTTLAGFLPDVATTFGGIWQSVRLRRGGTGFAEVQVIPDPENGVIRLTGDFRHPLPSGPAPSLTLQISIAHGEREVARLFRPLTTKHFDLTLHVPNFQRWSPAAPHCYRLFLVVRQGNRVLATHQLPVAFRRLTTVGEQLLLNDEPICLRGVLSWGWQPDRIAPHYTADAVRAEIRRVKAQGFNLIKLCLFIPNQIYYEIADEEGILLWQEWPLWLPDLTPALRQQALTEYAAYMALTCHHPAVVIYSLGCELDQGADAGWLAQLNEIVRNAVRDVLVCDNSGSGEAYGGLTVDFADFTDYHTYGELHFLEATLDNWRRDWQPPRPWIFGEFCDADGFRDLAVICTANGGVAPWWMSADNPTHHWRPEVRALVEAQTRLQQADLPFTAPELVQIAANQALMVRKYTLETVRKRAAVQGYVVTGLRDTPIATSGIFDDFDRPKWDPGAFLPFNDDAILCLDVGRSRHWHHGGDRAERLDLHNWWAGEAVRLQVILNQAAQTLQSGRITWQVSDAQGVAVAGGEISPIPPVPPGRPIGIGVIDFILPAVATAQQYTLQVTFVSRALHCQNAWPIWAYAQPAVPSARCVRYDHAGLLADFVDLGPVVTAVDDRLEQIVVTSQLDGALLDYLLAGGRVLLVQQTEGVLTKPLPFWREAVKLIMPDPFWAQLPHQGFVDLQFFGLATDLAFDPTQLRQTLPATTVYTPLLRRLDARTFGVTDYLVALQVGAGRLLATTLRLQGGAGGQPTGLRRNIAGAYLLNALLKQLS